MKKIILTFAILATGFASAQVGIGNTDPKATLDVNKANYATGEQAGIAVTQQTAAQIEAMTTTNLKAGTLVYATTATGTTINAVGYWNWNGTAWVRTAGNNLYAADGTLSGARVVTQAANRLSFTSTAVNGFSVDGTTFSVDAANNRIGIGTASPSNPLSVSGNGTSFNQINAFNDGNTGNANSNAGIRIASTSRNSVINMLSGDTGNSSITFGRTSDNVTNGLVRFNASDNSLQLGTQNALIGMTMTANRWVGIGTTTPQSQTEIVSLDVAQDRPILSLTRYNGSTFGFGQNGLAIRNVHGSLALPEPFPNSKHIGSIDFSAYATTGFRMGSRIISVAREVFDDTKSGSSLILQTTQIGTTTPTDRLNIDHDGQVYINNLAGTGNRMVVALPNGGLTTQAIPGGATVDGSETKVNAGSGISVTGSGTTAAPYVVSQAPLAVTVPTTNDYTVLETDAIIYRNLTANGTITFPASLPAGKVFYIANTSGSFDWVLSPAPLNAGTTSASANLSLTVVTVGSGNIIVTAGY
jgi:hypothetical protein